MYTNPNTTSWCIVANTSTYGYSVADCNSNTYDAGLGTGTIDSNVSK